MKSSAVNFWINAGLTLWLAVFLSFQASGQNAATDRDTSEYMKDDASGSGTRRTFRMTSFTFGGNGVNLTRVNDQFSIMTGGRGSATFNGRYTIGGGGWGMTRGVEAGSSAEGVYNFIKMGYGGVDLGYLFVPGDKFDLGAKLLVGGGAVFKETVPASNEKSYKMFPVMEPTVYCQISLSRLFRFEMGTSYRIIRGTKLPYVTDNELSGFSCYIGFLVSAGR